MNISADIIPVDWPKWSKTKPNLLKPLLGGLTNKSYLISADNADMVLRKNSTISAALNLDRVTEARVLVLADDAGLCAPLIHYDSDYQYVVSRYVEGKHWRADEQGIRSLATLLQRIHRLPAIDKYLTIADKAERYWQAIAKNAPHLADLKKVANKMMPLIESAKRLGSGACLCHNDLLRENLISTEEGRLYAIDWEYAAMGDPFYELAVIVEGQALKQSQQELLLSEYLARPISENDRQHLRDWQLIYCYLTVLWYAVQWSSGVMATPETSRHIAQQIQDLGSRIGD